MSRYVPRSASGKQRRIQVTVPEPFYERLRSTADALDTSMSALVCDLIDSAMPVLEVLEDAARAVQEAPEKQRETMRLLADELAEQHGQNSERLAEVVALGGAAGDDPRASNTGVSTDG